MPGTYGPAPSHMAIVKLMEEGKLDFLVSQNTDGLHLRSGVPFDRIAELHGNTNKEQCQREYIRPFHTRTAAGVNEHETGCRCESCGGPLRDTIVNFGESLPRDALQKAWQKSENADLAIVLGSSMRVSPANELPQLPVCHGKPLVIVNLQKTPLDPLATLRIFAKTHEVMEKLMDRLGYDIPPARDVASEPAKPAIPKQQERMLPPVRDSLAELMQRPAAELKRILADRGISTKGCLEKGDYVDEIERLCRNVAYTVPVSSGAESKEE